MAWKGDPNAFHKVVDGEIAGLTEKASPVDADLIVIEDSADGNSKKKAQLSNLPGGGGGGSFTYSGAGVKRTTSNQAISSSTATAIAFNGEDWDTDTYHDNSTNNTRLTVPTSDKYLLTGTIAMINLDSSNVLLIQVAVNGTLGDTWLFRADGVGQATRYHSFAHVLELSASDYVEVYVQQNTGAFDVQADRTRVQISRLG